MAAGQYDLLIEQGATFQRTITVLENGVAKVLDGFSGRAQVRRSHANATILQTITVNITDPTNGIVVISLTPTQTTALVIQRAVWDLELVDSGGDVIRLLAGSVEISPEVTRT